MKKVFSGFALSLVAAFVLTGCGSESDNNDRYTLDRGQDKDAVIAEISGVDNESNSYSGYAKVVNKGYSTFNEYNVTVSETDFDIVSTEANIDDLGSIVEYIMSDGKVIGIYDSTLDELFSAEPANIQAYPTSARVNDEGIIGRYYSTTSSATLDVSWSLKASGTADIALFQVSNVVTYGGDIYTTIMTDTIDKDGVVKAVNVADYDNGMLNLELSGNANPLEEDEYLFYFTQSAVGDIYNISGTSDNMYATGTMSYGFSGTEFIKDSSGDEKALYKYSKFLDLKDASGASFEENMVLSGFMDSKLYFKSSLNGGFIDDEGVATENYTIPMSAKIGDSGSIGTYLFTDLQTGENKNVVINWSMNSTNQDNIAALLIQSSVYDINSTIASSVEKETYYISKGGNVESFSVVVTENSIVEASFEATKLADDFSYFVLPNNAPQTGTFFEVSGVDSDGTSYIGSKSIQNMGQEIIDGVNYTAVKKRFELASTIDPNDSHYGSTTEYIDAEGNIAYVFVEESGKRYKATSKSHKPAIAKIGDSGSLGTFVNEDNASDTASMSWELKSSDSSPFFAVLEVVFTHNYANGERSVETTDYIINKTGYINDGIISTIYVDDALKYSFSGKRVKNSYSYNLPFSRVQMGTLYEGTATGYTSDFNGTETVESMLKFGSYSLNDVNYTTVTVDTNTTTSNNFAVSLSKSRTLVGGVLKESNVSMIAVDPATGESEVDMITLKPISTTVNPFHATAYIGESGFISEVAVYDFDGVQLNEYIGSIHWELKNVYDENGSAMKDLANFVIYTNYKDEDNDTITIEGHTLTDKIGMVYAHKSVYKANGITVFETIEDRVQNLQASK